MGAGAGAVEGVTEEVTGAGVVEAVEEVEETGEVEEECESERGDETTVSDSSVNKSTQYRISFSWKSRWAR